MNNKTVSVKNLSRQEIKPLNSTWCNSFLSRLKGFTFRSKLEPNESLILVESRESRLDTSIHMFFVWTDLSIAWINSNNQVVDCALAKSWRPFYGSQYPAMYVLEYHPSRFGDFQTGDYVSFIYEK